MIIAALLGLSLAVYLIIHSGAPQVAHAMLVVGWWLVPITLFYFVPSVLNTLSWRAVIPAATRPATFTCFWMRWIRESINSVVPIGGDVAGVRLVVLQGVPAEEAATSIVVDVTVGVVTQLIFVLAGVGLLLTRSTDRGAQIVAATVLIGTGVLGAATAAFVMFQHRGLFAGAAKIAQRLLPGQWQSAFAIFATGIDDALVASYRRRRVILRAAGFRLAAWAAGSGEVWLVLQSLGHPTSMVDAFILESLGAGVRAVAFMVPGGLGALEGSFVLFGALFGLPADTALAVSLSKRVRELAWGVPGLLVWHWIEGHRLLRRVRA